MNQISTTEIIECFVELQLHILIVEFFLRGEHHEAFQVILLKFPSLWSIYLFFYASASAYASGNIFFMAAKCSLSIAASYIGSTLQEDGAQAI